jgi:hypothetical protein
MFKLLRMTLLSLPLAGGVALAQSAPLDGPQGINPTSGTGTTDTRTPTQKTAGDIDTGNGSAPNDLVPGGGVRTAPMSNTAGMPDSKQTDSTTTEMQKSQKSQKKDQKSSSGTDATPMVNPENGMQNDTSTTKSSTTKSTDTQHDTENSDK